MGQREDRGKRWDGRDRLPVSPAGNAVAAPWFAPRPTVCDQAAVKATLTAGKTHTITVKLPKSALTALEAGDRESVSFKLTATNANGTAKATAKIPKLKLVKVST